jgi:Niemann-Pick C1 protein
MRLRHFASAAGLLSLTAGELYTPKHEAGRCAIRENCGGGGFFNPPLPCPDNGPAEEPEADVRKQLVEMCGPKWNTGPVCCEGSQVCIVLRGTNLLLISYSLIYCPRTSKKLNNSSAVPDHNEIASLLSIKGHHTPTYDHISRESTLDIVAGAKQ